MLASKDEKEGLTPRFRITTDATYQSTKLKLVNYKSYGAGTIVSIINLSHRTISKWNNSIVFILFYLVPRSGFWTFKFLIH